MVLCPINSCTVRISTPAMTKREASVCQVMKPKTFNPSLLHCIFKGCPARTIGFAMAIMKQVRRTTFLCLFHSLLETSRRVPLMGTDRPSLFFAYPALTLTSPRAKSISSERRLRSSLRRKPVCSAVTTKGRSCSLHSRVVDTPLFRRGSVHARY